MTPKLRMPKILSDLSSEEIAILLRKWNLPLSGRKSEKILRIENYLQELNIDDIPNYDFEMELTEVSNVPSGSNNEMDVILQHIQNFMQGMEKRFEEFTSQHGQPMPSTPMPQEQDLPNDEIKRTQKFTLQPFWKQNPELWFSVADQKFQNFNIIADSIKFSKVIEALEVSTINKISNLIRNPPQVSKYATLKNQLISLYEESQESKLNRIFEELQLGDQKPSQLFREIKNLADDKISDEVLFSIWVKKLPTECAQNLRGLNKVSSLSNVLQMADGMLECSKPNITAIKTESNFEVLSKKLDTLIDTFQKQYRSSRNQFRSSSRTRPRSTSNKEPLCFYHRRFKDKANKCVPPCSFTNKSENSLPQH